MVRWPATCFVLLLLAALLCACPPDDDDDSTPDDDSIDDDAVDDDVIDDDAIDDDVIDDDVVDDDAIDDDVIDDDAVDDDTIDDDAVDDDAVDDDIVDDDVVDDDVIDDDLVDDDTIDDDVIDDDTADDDTADDDLVVRDLFLEIVDGGPPGKNDAEFVIGPDGTKYAVATRSFDIYLYINGEAGDWQEHFIARPANDLDLAVDQAGRLHLAYQDIHHKDLIYATNAGGDWQFFTVDEVGNVGAHASLGVDSAGHAHIAYYDQTHKNLKYATNAFGFWSASAVDTPGDMGQNVDLAVDNDDFVHLAYRDNTNSGLKYATNAGGPWQKTTIEQTPEPGGEISLAVDASGLVHISYFCKTSWLFGALRYATNAVKRGPVDQMDDWAITQLAAGDGNVGTYNSIALDENGAVYISYYWEDTAIFPNRFMLKMVTNRAGGWHYHTVDDPGWFSMDVYSKVVGLHNAIAVDGEEQAHVIHGVDRLEYGLRYVAENGGEWDKSEVKYTSRVCHEPALVVDQDGHAHISYQATVELHSNLQYTANQSGAWATDVVDEGWSVDILHHYEGKYPGSMSSIALDSDGNAHISYQYHYSYYESKGAAAGEPEWYTEYYLYYLGYARNTGGDWYYSYRDTDGCGYTSLVLDANEKPQIVYYHSPASMPMPPDADSYTPGLLITSQAAAWQMEVVDEEGRRFNSLARAQDGSLHVAYVAQVTDADYDLKYATDRSGVWEAQIIETSSLDYGSVALALDADEFVHLAYFTGEEGDLHYANNVAGGWEIEAIESAGQGWQYVSLAVDGQGAAHLAYYNATQERLKYATNQSGEWLLAKIVPYADVGRENALFLDGENQVHVAFTGDNALWYARFAAGAIGPAGGR